jgi:hypothetical protein
MVSDEDAATIYLRGAEEICHHSLTLKKTGAARLRAHRLPRSPKTTSTRSTFRPQ